MLRCSAIQFRTRQRLLSARGTGERVGADCAPGLRAALPQNRVHHWISGLGCRRETHRTTFVLRAREDAMARASRERCSLRTAKRPDPPLPDEIGKERTDDTAVPIDLAGPVELIVLSVKQKAAR